MLCNLRIFFAIFTVAAFDLKTFAAEKPIHGESKESSQAYYQQFEQIFEKVDRDYVQEPDKQKMVDSAISGMLSSLDPHSNYFTDEDLKDFIDQTKGEFGGIGVELMYDNGAMKVISPIDDLPADRAGIKPGDYILGVNQDTISNLGFTKAIKEMRGEPGTKVKLLILKENESAPKTIELTREIVKIKPIKSHLENGKIAYIRIVTFNESTIDELKQAVKRLNEKAGAIDGIVLDLRNNPGGLLDQAVSVSQYFVESGVIVSTKGRLSSSNNVYNANRLVQKAPKVPLVVMINSGTASASEIVAGAIQDHKRGIVIGTTSFGKGSVQTVIPMSARSAIKLTTAKYYTPSGHSIQAEGIVPDLVVEQAQVEYPQAKPDEKRFSEMSLKNHLKNDNAKGKDSKTTKDGEGTRDTNDVANDIANQSELYKKDYQFARAYDLVRGLIINNKMSSDKK